tara:strand:+ start:176 stop:430 length:255 start_codon:yes stop_codon:yes gene_type:complete
MDNPTDNELIEIIARNILDILKRLEHIEQSNESNEKILMFLEDVFNPPKDLVSSDEEMVAFSKELYKQICEYCGEDGLQFMAIA